MVRAAEGVYRNGKVELREPLPSAEGARVIVAFLPADGAIDLAARGISPEHARDLRARFKSFEEDWQQPEMDAYDAL